MVDNSSLPVASGNETFANDDIGGIKYPRPKINWGPDGTANDVDVASGKPLPVQLRGSDGTDRSNLLPVSVSSIAAGTNAIGKLAANSGVDIGDVDVTSVPTDPFGANADAASATTSISAKLRGIATALGITALDLGSGTGGSRTLRWFLDTAQWIGGAGAVTSATQRTTLASDDPLVNVTGARADAKSIATDTTAISAMSVWKQISASVQALVTSAVTVGTAGTPSTQVLTVQGIAGSTPQTTGGVTVTQAASSTITRPADTTAYASGDLVANSVTAGSVAALQFTTLARISGGSGIITGARIQKSTNSVTNAAFRVHYFSVVPTFTSAGDNSALSTVVVASAKGYLGYVDITAMTGFSDVAWGTGGVDNSRAGLPFVAVAQIIYAIVEARGAYTPGNAEVFTLTTFALQD